MPFRFVRTRRRMPMAMGTARRTIAQREIFVFGTSRPGGILPKTLSSARPALHPEALATRIQA